MSAFHEPESDPPPPEDQAKAKSSRPDWLVGAEEGLQAELESGIEPGSTPSAPAEGPAAPRPVLTRRDEGVAPPPKKRLPELDDARTRAGGFVPRLEITTELKPEASTPARNDMPEPAATFPSAAETGPDLEFDAPRRRFPPGMDFPDASRDPTPLPEEAPTPARSPIAEVVVEVARRSWKWAAGAAALILVGTTLAHAIGIGLTPIRQVLRNPASFDGRTIRVRGRVSEDVFNVGGSYTYYLLQGRDSVVVFTRFRIPHPKQGMELEAMVSTGTLNDALRPALLEIEPSRKK